MRKSIKALAVALLVTLAVPFNLHAQIWIDKEIPDDSTPLVKFVGENPGGQKTISNVITKNGVAFVDVKDLAKAYHIAANDYKHDGYGCWYTAFPDQNELSFDVYIRDEGPNNSFNVYDVTFKDNKDTQLPMDKLAGYKSNRYTAAFTDSNRPFCENNKLYVPAKLFIMLTNNNPNTPITYNADNHTITFQDELKAPIYTCRGYCYGSYINGTYREYLF